VVPKAHAGHPNGRTRDINFYAANRKCSQNFGSYVLARLSHSNEQMLFNVSLFKVIWSLKNVKTLAQKRIATSFMEVPNIF